MATLSKAIIFGAAIFGAQTAYAAPTARSDNCDFGIAVPSGWQSIFTTQWCGMINNEVASLKSKEASNIMLPSVQAQYKQAGIKAPADSALPNIDNIMKDKAARAAMTQMKANYPLYGSMDLTAENIQTVYSDAIKAACTKTGVPEDIMVKIIYTESKGHPLVYQGLTQMDYVAWGQMADQNKDLKNRYNPADNIMASAMFLAKAKSQYGGDWATTYSQHYQDPTAASRAAAAA